MPEARIISYGSIYYHTAYGETPDFIEDIANNTVLDATYLPALVADGMQFMGWYSTHTFDDGTEVSVGDLVRDHSSSGPLHLYAKWSTLTVSSVLTNLADEIRVLSGTTEPLGLDEMATNVGAANTQVAEIEGLIEELNTALDGKSVPGGGTAVETCTVTVSGTSSSYRPYYISATVIDENGNVSAYTLGTNSATSVTVNRVVCGSVITVYFYGHNNTGHHVTNAQMLLSSSSKYFNAYQITASAGETASINMSGSSSGGA